MLHDLHFQLVKHSCCSACRARFESDGAGAGKGKASKLWLLWSKFPKFVFGFLVLSCVITLLEIPLGGTAQGVALLKAMSSMSRWWMCLAFVGIGLATDCQKLLKEALKGGAVALYLLTNAIDIVLALGLSALCFGDWSQGDS